jgi:hypothetical protein
VVALVLLYAQLTTKQATAMLKVPPPFLVRRIKDGKLPA